VTLFGGNRSVPIYLSVVPTGVRAGLAVARKEMSDFARAGVEASQKHQRAWDGVADGLGKTGLALGAFAAVSVVSFARFDKAMSRAQAGTQATASQMTALRAAALKAGADTQFSATQAADAITEMGKAGVKVQDILGGGLQGTLALAAAGELEVARAAEIGATALTQFGLSGNQLPHVADVLAAGAGKAQGSVDDLAQALKYVGPVSNNLGVSIEETTGTLALFAKQGIIGEQAGTSLRGMMLSLTSPSAKAAETMKDLGINLYDAQGQFIGINGVAGELAKGMQGLTEAEKNAALGVIFGNEQVTAATVLYQGGARAVNEWTKSVDDSGFAARQAAQLMDNLAGDVEQLKGSLETAFIQSGSGANEGLRTLTQGATGAVNAFLGLPESVQKSTVVVAGVGSAALLATAGVLKLVSATVAARTNLAALGVTAGATKGALLGLGRVGAAAAGFAALGYAGSQFVDSAEEAAVKAGVLTKALAELGRMGATTERVGSFGRNFDDLGRQLQDLSDPSLRRRFEDFHNTISGFVTFGQVGSSKGTQERANLIEDLRRTDAALAGLVSSGKMDEAKRQFDALNEKAISGGAGVNQLAQHLPAYQDALKGAAAATGDASGATGAYRQGVQNLAEATKQAREATDALIASTDEYTSRALDARATARGYEAALDAVSASLKENGRSLDITTEKGRANQEALDNIVASGKAHAQATYEQTGSSEKFRAILVRTRAELIRNYLRFDQNRGRANAYADTLLKIPSKAETRVMLRGVDSALLKLGIIRQTMARINGETVTVTVRQSGEVNIGPGGRVARAEGGILPGPPSNRDNMVIAAASGEYVINARQTARHRPLLDAINEGRLPGFADGGYVDAMPFSPNDVFQRYEDSRPKPITAQQVAAALRAAATAEDRRKNSALALRNAERDLYVIRRKHPENIQGIKDAEDRLIRARRSHAAAQRNEAERDRAAADALRRRNVPRGFNLGAVSASLLGTVQQTEAYRRQLAAVEKRGGNTGKRLAEYLAGMGAEGAPLVAALVKADQKTFVRILQLLRRLDPEAFKKQATESVTRFANGGLQPHIATGIRMWGEPETGGEAYIPLSPAKRPRSRMLAEDVVERLGGAVAWSTHRTRPAARNAVSAAPSRQNRGDSALVNVEHLHLVRGTPEQVGSEIMFSVRAAGG
jgi:TP901 family phage tail tape measure protein